MIDSLQSSSALSKENSFDINDMCVVASELCEHFGAFTSEIYGVSILENPQSTDIYDRIGSLKQECEAAAEKLSGAKLQKWVDSNMGRLNGLIEECAAFTQQYEYPFFADSLSAWMLRMHDEDRLEEAAAECEEQITITAIQTLVALMDVDELPQKDEIAAVLDELDFIRTHMKRLDDIDDPDNTEITIETMEFLHHTIDVITERYPNDIDVLNNFCAVQGITIKDCLDLMLVVRKDRLNGSSKALAEKFCDAASNFFYEKRADCVGRIRALRDKILTCSA